VFKAETGEKLLDIKAHEDEVLCCAFSSDDSYIATCSADKKVKVRRWSSGSVLKSTFHSCRAPVWLLTTPILQFQGT
jgi:WD40 repeat protein